MRTSVLLILVFTISSCESSPQKNDDSEAKTISIEVQESQQAVMSDIFQDITYLTLKVDEKFSFGRIGKMRVTEKHFFLLDLSNASVWIFTRRGELLHQVRIPAGNGPGEVQYLGDFDIDENLIHALG